MNKTFFAFLISLSALAAFPHYAINWHTSLSTANWTNSTSGASNPVIVPATLPTKFYPLSNPDLNLSIKTRTEPRP